MGLKIKIIIVFIFFVNSHFAQINKAEGVDSIFNYKELFEYSFKYYNDSISRIESNYIIAIKIVECDTSQKKLRISFNYSWGCPIPIKIIPTHYFTYNNIIYVVRFDDKLSNELVKNFPFNPLFEKDLDWIKKVGELNMKKNNNPTGSTDKLIIDFNNLTLTKYWFNDSYQIKEEDLTRDINWMNNRIPYKNYIKEKLKHYGYLE